MKKLVNLLTVLAVLLTLTEGCGLRGSRNRGPSLLQLGQVLNGGSRLTSGTTGAALTSAVVGALGASSGGGLLNGLSTLHGGGLSSGVITGTSGLGSTGGGSGLEAGLRALGAGMGSGAGGTLLAGIEKYAAARLRATGSSGGSGPGLRIPGSGATTEQLLGQGLQRTGQAFGGGVLLASSNTAHSETHMRRQVLGTTAGIPSDVAGNQPGGLISGVGSVGGVAPASNLPTAGGSPGAIGGIPGIIQPVGGIIGGPRPAGLPVGASRGSSASMSSISVSGTANELGQPVQQMGQGLGIAPVGAAGIATSSAVSSAAHFATRTVGTYTGTAVNPNGGVPGSGSPSGGGTLPSSGAGSGPGSVPIGRPIAGLLGGAGMEGLSPGASQVGGSTGLSLHSSSISASVTNAVREQGQPSQQRGQGAPLPVGASSTIIDSAASTATQFGRSVLGISATQNVGGTGTMSGSGRPGSNGALPGPLGASPGVGNGDNLVAGLGGLPTDGFSGGSPTNGAVSGSIHSVSGTNVVQGQVLGQPLQQPSQALQPVHVGTTGSLISSAVSSAMQVAGSSTGSLLGTTGSLYGGATSPGSPSGRGRPGSSGIISGINLGEGHRPGGGQTGRMTSGQSFEAVSAAQHSTASMGTHVRGTTITNGLNMGEIPGQGAQPTIQAPSGGSVVSVSTSSHSSSSWRAGYVGNSQGHMGGSVPIPGAGGPAAGYPIGPSGPGSTPTGGGGHLLNAIIAAGAGGTGVGGSGSAPAVALGGLSSSGSSVVGSRGVISGIALQPPQRRVRKPKPSAAAATGIALGVVAGTLALSAIGSGIAGAIHSGMAGGGRTISGCGGGCPRSCGRKRRSVSQSKVPAEVLNSVPMDFNRL